MIFSVFPLTPVGLRLVQDLGVLPPPPPHTKCFFYYPLMSNQKFLKGCMASVLSETAGSVQICSL